MFADYEMLMQWDEEGFGEDETSEDPLEPFEHQRAFHIPPSPLSEKQCGAIPAWFIYELAKTSAEGVGNDPLVYHFQSGSLITEQNAQFEVGAGFCSIIFAPQYPPLPDDLFHNRPIRGWGPDSLHLEIASDDVRLIPEHPNFLGPMDVPSPEAVFAVYTVAYRLNHPGTYQMAGEVDFQNYDWVIEDPVNFYAAEQHRYKMIADPLQARSPAIVITGTPLSRPMQQCYRDGFNDLHGRWYRATSFSSSGSQTSLNPAAGLSFADHNTTTDEWGWTFAPDACSLHFFTTSAISSCLKDRSLQILGESNSRRLLKTLMSAGHWCTETGQKLCQCEDQWEEEVYDFNFAPMNSTRFRETSVRDTPTFFGFNSSVFFDFVGGLLNPKLFNPWFIFYDASPDDGSSIISRRAKEYGPVDLVHVSLLTWDIANIRTSDEVLASLPAFRAKLLSAYPPGTRFITRLANSMCCGNQDQKTRFSAPRFAMFNAMWRKYWAADEKSGAMLVDDASVLQGRRDAETSFYCPTTHLRGSHVRLEAMMWLNAVCEGDSSKEEMADVRMRDWGYKEAQIEAARTDAPAIPKS